MEVKTRSLILMLAGFFFAQFAARGDLAQQTLLLDDEQQAPPLISTGTSLPAFHPTRQVQEVVVLSRQKAPSALAVKLPGPAYETGPRPFELSAPQENAAEFFTAGQMQADQRYKIAARLESFLRNQLVPQEAQYFQPGFGTDEGTGMPYDHVRIRLRSQILGETGNYTAASKLSLSLPYLLGVAHGKPVFKQSGLSAPEASRLISKTLETLKKYNQNYPEYGGFLPWVDIRPNGTIAPASTKMPSLDNGQLTWALAALTAAFEDSRDPLSRKIARDAQDLLLAQNYSLFYDEKAGLLHGTSQMDPDTGEWFGDKTYYLNDMFEGILAVLWAVLHGQVPEEVWYNLKIPTTDYVSSLNEKVTTFQGFRASFHEHWALGYLPLMESSLAPLYQNFLYVQEDYASRNGLPGFISTAYDPRGNYRQMGIPEISENPVDRSDVAVVFATAMGMLVSPESGARWLKNIYRFRQLVSRYGAVESAGPDGYADIFTADAKGMTLLAASGGVVPEIKKYLRTRSVPRSGISMEVKLIELLHAKSLQMLDQRGGRPFYAPADYRVKLPQKTIVVDPPPLTDPGTEFDVSAHLQQGHLHGKNVRSLGHRTLEDDIRPGKKLAFEFDIPAYYPYFDQWAFRGTYINNAVRISEMRYVTFSIPTGKSPALFELEFKSDDMTLATVVVDTSEPGIPSRDGRWKTLHKKIEVIPEADYKPFNYISAAIHDPRYLIGKFAAYQREGEIQIKNIRLSRTDPLGGILDLMLEDENPWGFELIRYWRLSHGTLEFDNNVRYPALYRFSGGLGWRGGYLPYTDLSQFNFLYLTLRNLDLQCNCLNVELKHEDDSLIGYKIPIKLPPDKEWHTFEIEIPKGVRKSLNYVALSDPMAAFELASMALAPDPPEGATAVQRIPAQTLGRKPIRCQYRCIRSDFDD